MYQVMVVDDEPSALDELANYINRANLGFHVVTKALGAEDALFYLEMINPDLVITDIKMPVIDGLTMLQQMRQAGWNGHAAIITGHDDFAYAQQAIRLNVFEYLLKPVFPDDIAALLQRTTDLLNTEPARANPPKTENPTELPDTLEEFGECRLPSYIIQAKTFIKEHYWETLTLSKVAKIIAINPTYLSFSFAKHCGKNFLEYVTSYRMTKAKELLTQTNLQVQEVAIKVGYTDVAYFTRVFRRETGVTPGVYRSHN